MDLKKKRAPTAVVATQEFSTRRRFKYTYQGNSYYLTIPKKGVLTETPERQIAKLIELDIITGNHDQTQQTYKDMFILGVATGVVKSAYQQPRTEIMILHEELLHYYIQTGRDVKKDFYNAAYVMMKNWGRKCTIEMITQKLQGMNYAPKTFNNRKGILKGFCEWLLRHGRIRFNPVYDIPSRKKGSSKSNTRKRMTDQEVKSILEAIRTDRFVKSDCHRWIHSHYYPIISFIAYTGVRPAEAIGLQVKKINFKTKVITIDQSLARSRFGTSSTYRTMKGTKMDDSRELSFDGNQDLETILRAQCHGKKMDDLVFPSPTGLACDDRKINDNILVPVMKGLGIERRILYAFRHSFASRFFERGLDIKTVQSMIGHRDASVLLNTYAEISRTKAHLPFF